MPYRRSRAHAYRTGGVIGASRTALSLSSFGLVPILFIRRHMPGDARDSAPADGIWAIVALSRDCRPVFAAPRGRRRA